MNHDEADYEELLFPRAWTLPDDVRGRIFVGGLTPDNAEEYYLLDFDRRRTQHWRVVVEGYRRELADYLRARMQADDLPYGVRDFLAVTPNFLQPHEALELPDGTIAVAMHNAGYVRILGPDPGHVEAFPRGGRFEPVMLSATNSLSRDRRRLYFGEWSLDDRIAVYRRERTTVRVTVKQAPTNLGAERAVAEMEAYDSIHEVKVDPAERYALLTEFCLTTPEQPPPNAPDVFDDRSRWTRYEASGLFDSRLYLVGLEHPSSSFIVPPTKTPGHVEFSRERPDHVYLSSHNLSKANGRVILHGPGALSVVRVCGDGLQIVSECRRDDLFRVTSHKVFRRGGVSWVAATAYPNRIFLFDDASGALAREVVLFEAELPSPSGLHFSVLGQRIPIWLETSDDGRYVFLTSNHYLYLYDVDEDRVYEYAGYPFAGQFIGTAHITNLNDFRPTRSREAAGG